MNTRCGAMLDWNEYNAFGNNNDSFLNYCGLTIKAPENYAYPEDGESVYFLIKNLLEQYKLPINFDENKIFPILRDIANGIPYDLEFGADQSLYDVLKAIIELIPNQRMYIDEDLNLMFDYMPNTWLVTAIWSNLVYHRARDLANIVISESNEQNLTDFYNYVVVMSKVS